jgi:hypothetical protein
MLIREVADPNVTKLFGLAELLLGLAKDRAAKREYSLEAFVKMAQDMGIMVTPKSLNDLIQQPPLNTIVEPIDPGSKVIKLKDEFSTDSDVAMPVNKAQDIVASAAKSAMKRGLKR